MTAHIDRMNDELAELDDKRSKLSAFMEESPLFKKLEAEDQSLLERQLVHMTEYSQILQQRVDRAVTAK